MKNNFRIQNSADFLGKNITIRGWVYNKRSSGAIIFLHLRDGSGFLQAVVVRSEVAQTDFEIAKNLLLESAIEISGVLKNEPRAPGGFEVSVKNIKIIHAAQAEFPIGKKEHGPDFLLSHRHLWLRSTRQWAILRIRNQIIFAINLFLQQSGYTRIDTPIITPSACEGTTTLFEIDYFGDRAYLTQSGQLYLEAAIASFGKVFDFGPVLRAEKSKTRRHLIEFWMMDAEIAFMDFEELLVFEEDLIFFVVRHILDKCSQELKLIGRDTSPLANTQKPFPRLKFSEAVKRLHDLGSDIKDGEDFGNDDETLLMNFYKQPLFVTHYPASVKAFYCKRDMKDPESSLSGDLLAPEGYGEITGGGQREEDYDTLVKRIKEHGFSQKDYTWYLDLRKFGSVPHSGFGVGLERLVAWICKLDHVRETIPFPRLLERYYP